MILKLWLLKIQVHLTMIQGQLNSRNFDPINDLERDLLMMCQNFVGVIICCFSALDHILVTPTPTHTPTHQHTHTHQEHEVSVAGSSALGDVGHVDLV